LDYPNSPRTVAANRRFPAPWLAEELDAFLVVRGHKRLHAYDFKQPKLPELLLQR